MDMSDTARRAPALSIGMPVYNGERHIRQALDALLGQDFTDFELIISDNASTDATPEICAEYAARDGRIRFYRNPANMGMAWNFNRVFELAESEFFMWAAHDDYLDPRFARLCLQAFERSEDVVLSGSRIQFIDGDTGEVIFTNKGFATAGLNVFERLRFITSLNNMIGGIVYGIFRSSALRLVMPVQSAFATDIVLLARLSLLGEFSTVPEPLLFERSGGASSDLKKYVAEVHAGTAGGSYPYFDYFRKIREVIFRAEGVGAAGKIALVVCVLGECFYLTVITWMYRVLAGACPQAALRARGLWRGLQNKRAQPGDAGIRYRL